MAIMLAKTYDALRAAGAPATKAREAAEEIAGLDSRLGKIEGRLSVITMIAVAIATGIVALLVKAYG